MNTYVVAWHHSMVGLDLHLMKTQTPEEAIRLSHPDGEKFGWSAFLDHIEKEGWEFSCRTITVDTTINMEIPL